MNLQEAFPTDGISYSEQVLDLLHASPWLEEDVQKALVWLMMDLVRLKRGVPLVGVIGESREALKDFAEGGLQIGVTGPTFDMMVFRRGGYGWEVSFLVAKMGGLN